MRVRGRVPLRSRRYFLRLGAAGAGAALLAACGGDDGDDGNDEPTAAPAPATVETLPVVGEDATGAAGSGGVLRLGALRAGVVEQALAPLIYSRLVAVDPRSARVHADLAETVELPSPLEVVFRLRAGAFFHRDPDGQAAAVVAEDVRRDFESRAGEFLFDSIVERVDAPDDRTVALRLRAPFSLLFEFLADPDRASVRSEERYTTLGAPLGSGPFMPAARDAGGHMLARWQFYHRPGLPLLEGVSVLTADEQRDLDAAFGAGDLDVRAGADVDGVALARARDDAVALQRAGFGMIGLGLSLLADKGGRPVRSVEAFQDRRVRRAVSLALDREAVLRRARGVRSGPVGPAHGADALPGAELAAHPLHQNDPGGARALLAAAGAPDLPLRLQAPDRNHLRALSQLIEAQLREGGFAPRLQLIDPPEWEAAFRAGDFDATVFELEGLRTPDLGLRLHTSVGVEEGFSLWGYSNPVYDAAVRDALSALDPRLRAERSREAQRLLLDDVPAMFPLSAPLEYAAVSTRVSGFEFDAYGFNAAWLAARWRVAGAQGDAAGAAE